jgi:hypothetical protein
MGKNRDRKLKLPAKICPTCQRPFQWRKKWEKNWDSVVYCSHACRQPNRTQKK